MVHLGAILGHLDGILAYIAPTCVHRGGILANYGPSWGHLGVILGHLGVILSLSWGAGPPKTLIFLRFLFFKFLQFGDLPFKFDYLTLSCAILSSSWVLLGSSWDPSGPSWGHLGALLGHLGATLGPPGEGRDPKTGLKNLKKPKENQGFRVLGLSWSILGPS